MEITISLARHRIMYAFDIWHTLREHLFSRDLEELANFEFVLAKESTSAEQRNRLEYCNPNPNPHSISKELSRFLCHLLLGDERTHSACAQRQVDY